MPAGKLIIDWAAMPTYNTTMALLTGVALISIAAFQRSLIQNKHVNPVGRAINFGIIGIILFGTGLHMTLAWPLAKYFPFDNIIFGEPTLALGTLLCGLAIYLWRLKPQVEQTERPIGLITGHLRPLTIFLYAIALMQVALFFAGVGFQFFAAPKEEPISGNFADMPWLEAWALSLLYLAIGVCCFLTALFIRRGSQPEFRCGIVEKGNYILLNVCGWAMLLFGAMNYYTHIGLILHTMQK